MKNTYENFLKYLRKEAEEYYQESIEGYSVFSLEDNINSLLWWAAARDCEYSDLEAIADEFGVRLCF